MQPTIQLSRVFHVGALSCAPSPKPFSHEGNGLSVSLHPDEWRKIARLGSAPVHILEKSQGCFLDVLKLSNSQASDMLDWACSQGLGTEIEAYEVAYKEEDERGTLQDRFLLITNEEIAEDEHRSMVEEGISATIESIRVPSFTAVGEARIGFKVPLVFAKDLLISLWVEDVTELDGVWWNDVLLPHSYSAPRGTINLKSIPSWTRTIK
ncbi:hypothetical protein LC612_35260 [Nostoc sp. CHAB 5834]|nr:hypothetical protein [Nostoc sp. CHAB 5834]